MRTRRAVSSAPKRRRRHQRRQKKVAGRFGRPRPRRLPRGENRTRRLPRDRRRRAVGRRIRPSVDSLHARRRVGLGGRTRLRQDAGNGSRSCTRPAPGPRHPGRVCALRNGGSSSRRRGPAQSVNVALVRTPAPPPSRSAAARASAAGGHADDRPLGRGAGSRLAADWREGVSRWQTDREDAADRCHPWRPATTPCASSSTAIGLVLVGPHGGGREQPGDGVFGEIESGLGAGD